VPFEVRIGLSWVCGMTTAELREDRERLRGREMRNARIKPDHRR
jgi:hypothetical protein